MSGLFPDAHPDAEHPDRPDHEDFRLLASLLQDIDTQADAGVDVNQLMSVDLPSLMYVADQRMLRTSGTTNWYQTMSARLRIAVMGLYFDAFTLGVAFERARRNGS